MSEFKSIICNYEKIAAYRLIVNKNSASCFIAY